VALNVLILPDKFKGTLSAAEAARAMARGWNRARPDDSLKLVPMSDGGDGFGEVLSKLLGAQICRTRTVDAAHRPLRAKWWWVRKSKTAVIESAQVIGLSLLPPRRFHPFDLDTFGLGAVIRAAAAKGAEQCIIGIGGSATNDGGFGLARALGWRFLDREGNSIERWTDLRLAETHAPEYRTWPDRLVVAVDVQNPLLGPRGATRVYGPQKGLRGRDFEIAESYLRRLSAITAHSKDIYQSDAARCPGAGAAGGLGFGLLAFLNAQAEPGFDLIARAANLDSLLRWADLVITGEGRVDRSTFMGKGSGQIGRRCHKLKIPCVALAGQVSDKANAGNVFTSIHALTDLTSVTAAQSRPALWLERLAAKTAAEINGDGTGRRVRRHKAKA
jgi:glycerate kinase